MPGKYIRKELRIPVDNLPIKYKSLHVLLSERKKLSVHTADASLHGIGLLTKDSTSEINIGNVIKLDLFGQEQIVYGKVVYLKSGFGMTRIGLSIENIGAYNEYKSDIKQIMKRKKKDNNTG